MHVDFAYAVLKKWDLSRSDLVLKQGRGVGEELPTLVSQALRRLALPGLGLKPAK